MSYLNVGQLREAIADLPDEMELIMRIEDDAEGGNHMGHVVSAIPDAGCNPEEVEVLMLDGYENDIAG